MHPRWPLYCLTAGVLAVTPCAGYAATSEVLSSGPRVDLAVEIDYRTRFLGPDDLLRDDAPPDRIGRERLDDARRRVAQAYARSLTDALLGEVTGRLPAVARLERKYERMTTVRLRGRQAKPRGVAAEPESPAPGPLVADAHGVPVASDAWVHAGLPDGPVTRGPRLVLPPRPEVDDDTEVRFRLNGGGLALRLAPTIELQTGLVRCRASYVVNEDRVEVAVGRRLYRSLSLELQSYAGSDSGVSLGFQLPF